MTKAVTSTMVQLWEEDVEALKRLQRQELDFLKKYHVDPNVLQEEPVLYAEMRKRLGASFTRHFRRWEQLQVEYYSIASPLPFGIKL